MTQYSVWSKVWFVDGKSIKKALITKNSSDCAYICVLGDSKVIKVAKNNILPR